MEERLNIDLILLSYYDSLLKDWIEEQFSNKTPLVEIEPSSAITIDPNKVYTVTSALSENTVITFNDAEEENGYCNKYTIIFTVDSSITVTFPSGTLYKDGNVPTYVTGRTYEAKICNGLAVINEYY